MVGPRNPFAGTPVGGQPHWFARPGSQGPFNGEVADAIHDTARAAAWSSVIAAGLTYAQTRDTQRAVRAAVITWPYMFALGLIGIVGGLAWFVLLVEALLLFGDHGLSVFCAFAAGLSTWAFVALLRSYLRRMNVLSGRVSSH
jgi:hypothetical protein